MLKSSLRPTAAQKLISMLLLHTAALLCFSRAAPAIFGFGGRPKHTALRVRIVCHGIPDYETWLAANGPYFEAGAAPAYPPEAQMFVHREVFITSADSLRMYYLLFFEPAGEAALEAVYGAKPEESPLWQMAEDAGYLTRPVYVKHLDASELFPADEVVIPAPGETWTTPTGWPEAIPDVKGGLVRLDCPVNVATGAYECV